MKHNTFKRILAGSLALLTVAAYVPANVGGLITDTHSIVASAKVNTSITNPIQWDIDSVEPNGNETAGKYMTSFQLGDNDPVTGTNLSGMSGYSKTPFNQKVTVKSSVPLDITATGTDIYTAVPDAGRETSDVKTDGQIDIKITKKTPNYSTDGGVELTHDNVAVTHVYRDDIKTEYIDVDKTMVNICSEANHEVKTTFPFNCLLAGKGNAEDEPKVTYDSAQECYHITVGNDEGTDINFSSLNLTNSQEVAISDYLGDWLANEGLRLEDCVLTAPEEPIYATVTGCINVKSGKSKLTISCSSWADGVVANIGFDTALGNLSTPIQLVENEFLTLEKDDAGNDVYKAWTYDSATRTISKKMKDEKQIQFIPDALKEAALNIACGHKPPVYKNKTYYTIDDKITVPMDSVLNDLKNYIETTEKETNKDLVEVTAITNPEENLGALNAAIEAAADAGNDGAANAGNDGAANAGNDGAADAGNKVAFKYSYREYLSPAVVPAVSAIEFLKIDPNEFTYDESAKTWKKVSTNKAVSAEDVIEAVLEKAGYETDDKTFTLGSSIYPVTGNEKVKVWDDDTDDFVLKGLNEDVMEWKGLCGAEEGDLYVAVGMEVNETVEKTNKVITGYTYNWTMPKTSVDVKLRNEDVEMTYFKSEDDRDAEAGELSKANLTDEKIAEIKATYEWSPEDTKDVFTDGDGNGYWDNLRFNVADLGVNDDRVKPYENEDEIYWDLLYGQTIGRTMTVTNKKPFLIKINDNNNKNNWIEPDTTYDSKNQVFTATFTMPASASADKKVNFQLIKIDEEYVFTESGSQLLASTKSASIKNAVAAEIEAKFYDEFSDVAEIVSDDDKKGTEISSTVANGKFVAVRSGINTELLTENGSPAFTITKDGTPLTALTSSVSSSTTDGTYYKVEGTGSDGKAYYAIFNVKEGKTVAPGAGEYTISYKVQEAGQSGTAGLHTITKSFTIAAKDALVAEDVELVLTAKKDNKLTDVNAVITGVNLDETIKAGKTDVVIEYMLDKDQAEAVKKADYQFTVTPCIDKLDDVYSEVTLETHAAAEELEVDPNVDGTKVKDYQVTQRGNYKVTGNPSGSSLDKVYKFTINIYDPEYGGSKTNPKKINISWKVKDYKEEPQFGNGNVVVAAQDVDELLADNVFDACAKNAAAKELKEEINANVKKSYKYVVGQGASLAGDAEDDLDDFTSGLPSKIGKYTVYMMVNGTIKAQCNVNITAYRLNIAPANEEELNLTYGQKLNFTKFTLTDSDGKAVTKVTANDVKVKFGYPVYDTNGKVTDISNFDVQDDDAAKDNFERYGSAVLKLTGANLETYVEMMMDFYKKNQGFISIDKLADTVGFLDAGVYPVVFEAESSDPDNYSIASDAFNIVVSKKKLSDSSVSVLIAPHTYDGKAFDVVKNGTVTAKDNQTGLNISEILKITEGPKEADVTDGKDYYSVKVGLVTTQINYEGTVNAKWHITYAENKQTINAGLEWNEEKTTLYNAGNIHLEIDRNANDKFKANGKKISIKRFGVIVDKEAKIAAPAKYGVIYTDQGDNPDLSDAQWETAEMEKANAENQLQLGNGFTEGGYKETTDLKPMDNTTYKVNIAVVDVYTGVWARPYILLEDDTVIYGDVKYVDLTNEAVDKLQLTMPIDTDDETGTKYATAVREADLTANQKKNIETKLKYVKSGYDAKVNKFYAYTSFKDLETAGFGDVLQVSDFGVVLDKKGALAALPEEPVAPAVVQVPAGENDDVQQEAYEKYLLAVEAYEKELKEYNDAVANVDKKLRIGGANGLIVGHYNKKNSVLKYNEYAAEITPYNTVTGIWVRPYLDLGEGLVIYGTPVYVSDVSDFFNYNNEEALATPALDANWKPAENVENVFVKSILLTTDGEDYTGALDVIAEKTGVDKSKIKITQTGVVVDKKGVLDKADKDFEWSDGTGFGWAAASLYADTCYPDAYQKMVLGNDKFKSGSKVENILTEGYVGKITPIEGTDLVARGYTIYDVDGTELTIYGRPTAYKATNGVYATAQENLGSSMYLGVGWGNAEQQEEPVVVEEPDHE